LLETSSVQGALDLLDHIDENNPFELIYKQKPLCATVAEQSSVGKLNKTT
jgi:hypothetical protein